MFPLPKCLTPDQCLTGPSSSLGSQFKASTSSESVFLTSLRNKAHSPPPSPPFISSIICYCPTPRCSLTGLFCLPRQNVLPGKQEPVCLLPCHSVALTCTGPAHWPWVSILTDFSPSCSVSILRLSAVFPEWRVIFLAGESRGPSVPPGSSRPLPPATLPPPNCRAPRSTCLFFLLRVELNTHLPFGLCIITVSPCLGPARRERQEVPQPGLTQGAARLRAGFRVPAPGCGWLMGTRLWDQEAKMGHHVPTAPREGACAASRRRFRGPQRQGDTTEGQAGLAPAVCSSVHPAPFAVVNPGCTGGSWETLKICWCCAP